jgi:hypothetical protein
LQQDSSFECGRDFCCQMTDNWTSVPSKWWHSEPKAMKSSNNLSCQSIVFTNKYNILSNSAENSYHVEVESRNLTDGSPYLFVSYERGRVQ